MSKLKFRREARAATENSLYARRKQKIRVAAGKIFLKKGFLATKLSDIAKEAEMDRASLYYYIGSKQDIFEDIFFEAVESNIKDAEAIKKGNLPPIEKLAKLIELLMTSYEEKYPYIYIFVQEDLKKIEHINDPKNEKWLSTSKKLSMRYYKIINHIITTGIDNGEINSTLPPRLLTNCIIGMLNSSSNWFRPNGFMTAEDIGKGMAKMLLNGLSSK